MARRVGVPAILPILPILRILRILPILPILPILGMVFFTLSATGCSESQLTGSLDTVYPLRFESQRIRLYSSSLSIEYVNLDGSVPVRISVDRAAIDLGVSVDLYANGDVTGRTSEGREVPRFDEGDIIIKVFDPVEGANVSGDFRAQFPVTDRDTLALAGRFAAPLEIVSDPGPEPPETMLP